MSACSKGVKFRLLADQLNESELIKVLKQIIKKCGRELLLTSLFKSFIQNNNENMDDVINIIETTLNSRKSKQIQSSITNKKALSALPVVLIGEIGSYLQYKEYINFARSNRAIHVGCNEIITIKHLDLRNIDNYNMINLQQYTHLDHLEIDLNRFNQLKIPSNGHSICNNLKELTLDFKTNSEADAVNIENMNFTNLKRLNCHQFGAKLCYFPSSNFYELLSKFSMIHHMELSNVFISNSQEFNQINELMPNLQGLEFTGDGNVMFRKQLIDQLCGNKLKYMTLGCSSRALPIDIGSNLNFDNLESLIIQYQNKTTMEQILNKVKKLKHVYIEKMMNVLTKEEIKKVTTKLLLEQKSMYYLGFGDKVRYLDAICDAVEYGLFDISQRESEYIKIQLDFQCDSTTNKPDIKHILLQISRILIQMQSSKIKDFMLNFTLYDANNCDDNCWREKISEFKVKHELSFDIYDDESLKIVITNKQCKINGFREQWKLSKLKF